MQNKTITQKFHAGAMSFTSTHRYDFCRWDGGAIHTQVWAGKFNAQAFGYLADSSMDVIQGGVALVVDVTDVGLAPDDFFRFADGDVPDGLPAITLIAKSEQRGFWERLAMDAKRHGLHFQVDESVRWGGA
jgi:hypothetical protein